jgi:transposase
MESKEIFSMALNICSPWHMKEVAMIRKEETRPGQIDIYIDFKPGTKFKDSTGTDCPVHDTIEKTWQHLNFFEHTCYIHARVPRIRTSNNKVEMVKVPWARTGSGFTLLFEAFAMLLIESEMPVKRAAKVLNIYDTRLWRIFNYWVARAVLADVQSDVVNIGIDETSTKKGHNYVTIAVDMKERRVIFVEPGKDAQVLSELKTHLESKGCPSEQIENISMDMSPSFISGVINNFPTSKITFDKFHIMQKINEAMDKVRIYQRKLHSELKGHKYLFLRNSDKLSLNEIMARSNFLDLYEDLGKAYKLKEMFNDFWEFASIDEASGYLSFWCDLAEESCLQPFISVSKTIKGHWSGVVNYFKSKLNNGILEGINSKIQLAKKRARGYRNLDNFINMIYFIAGKLKFDYPQYLNCATHSI